MAISVLGIGPYRPTVATKLADRPFSYADSLWDLPLWLRKMGTPQRPMFNIEVVR